MAVNAKQRYLKPFDQRVKVTSQDDLITTYDIAIRRKTLKIYIHWRHKIFNPLDNMT